METGDVIAHAVFESGIEVVAWDVTMMALVEGLGS
jgi:CxxC motif-containing protein